MELARKEQKANFYVLAKKDPENPNKLLFFWEITDAQNKKYKCGNFVDTCVWKESNPAHLEWMLNEYEFLSEFRVVQIVRKTTEVFYLEEIEKN